VLAALDGDLQPALVALMPQLLKVCSGHEEFIAWMKRLIKRPIESWQACIGRFAWLHQIGKNVTFPVQRWRSFVTEILTMKDHTYETYVQNFEQLDRSKSKSEDRAALLSALLRL
jgi:hypothetical protein